MILRNRMLHLARGRMVQFRRGRLRRQGPRSRRIHCDLSGPMLPLVRVWQRTML